MGLSLFELNWGMSIHSLHTFIPKQKATHRSKLLFVSSAYK